MIEDACRGAGVRCEVDPKEWAVFVKGLNEREFDAVILYASASDPWKDPYEEFHSSQIGPRAENYAGWVNPEVDRLVEAMREEFDDARRAEMFHRLNHLFHDEVPQLLLVHGRVGVLLNKRMQGARVRPTGLRDFDMWIRPEDWGQ
jgi:peptide/nickel transport system substrate-binding protein